jgi:hypothetical protein
MIRPQPTAHPHDLLKPDLFSEILLAAHRVHSLCSFATHRRRRALSIAVVPLVSFRNLAGAGPDCPDKLRHADSNLG